MTDVVKVLIPLDGSKLAEHALAYVPALRPLGDLQFEFLTVLDSDSDSEDRRGEAQGREENLMLTYLLEIAGEIRTHLGVEVGTKVLSGTPAQSIIEEEKSFGADFLVISTHGASGISRWRFGSVTDKLIRGASCNTLVIGPEAAEREQWLIGELTPAFKNLMVPLDGSALAEEALPQAQRFAEAFGSHLHLIRTVSLTALGADAASASSYWTEMSEAMVKEATDYLRNVAGPLPSGIKSSVEVEVGAPSDRLTEYVTKNAIDLVVMTTHGRSGLTRTALGSVTDRLLGGDAPVLVVRHQD